MYDGSFENFYDNNVDNEEHRFGVVEVYDAMHVVTR